MKAIEEPTEEGTSLELVGGRKAVVGELRAGDKVARGRVSVGRLVRVGEDEGGAGQEEKREGTGNSNHGGRDDSSKLLDERKKEGRNVGAVARRGEVRRVSKASPRSSAARLLTTRRVAEVEGELMKRKTRRAASS